MSIQIHSLKKNRIMKRILCIGMIVSLLFTVSACTQFTDTGIYYISTDTDVDTLSDATIDKITENVVNSMTLNEKIGQLFVVDLSSLESSRKSVKKKTLTKTLKRNMRLYPVGGVILYSADIKTPKQTKRLLENLQKQSAVELFTCVDEEGGKVARISSNPKMKVQKIPSMLEVGSTKDSSKAQKIGTETGKELKKLGFNVNFAPVADVLEDGDEAIEKLEIGSRSFGYDATEVSKMVKAYVKGIRKQRVLATLKHFPGQGEASMDTHVGAADIALSISELRNREFLPFQSGIKAGAEFVMLSQASVNSVTGDTEPVCMSSLVIHDILRDELGFEGLVITDAMNMASIVDRYDSKTVAVNCVNAGVDIILMPDDLEEAYDGLLDAVKDGSVTEASIDASVHRIIRMKIRNKILPLTSQVVEQASQKSFDNYHDIGELQQEGAK